MRHLHMPCPHARASRRCPSHWPRACSWAALEQLVSEKKLRAAGVSNFNLDQMAELIRIARIKPAVLQSNSGAAGGARLGLLLRLAWAGVRWAGRSGLGWDMGRAGMCWDVTWQGLASPGHARAVTSTAQPPPCLLPGARLPCPCRPAAPGVGAAGLLPQPRHPVPGILLPGGAVAGGDAGGQGWAWAGRSRSLGAGTGLGWRGTVPGARHAALSSRCRGTAAPAAAPIYCCRGCCGRL